MNLLVLNLKLNFLNTFDSISIEINIRIKLFIRILYHCLIVFTPYFAFLRFYKEILRAPKQ